jgi:hypothetical protein
MSALYTYLFVLGEVLGVAPGEGPVVLTGPVTGRVSSTLD